MSPSEISSALGLSALKNRTWAIFKTSAIKGEGLEEAMEWLVIKCLTYIPHLLRTSTCTCLLSIVVLLVCAHTSTTSLHLDILCSTDNIISLPLTVLLGETQMYTCIVYVHV